MNDKEKAICNLKYYNEQDPYWNGTYKPVTDFEKFCYEHCKDINTVINLLEKKDKIIDLMAEDIFELINATCNYAFEKYKDIQEVKQYFENKVKENK